MSVQAKTWFVQARRRRFQRAWRRRRSVCPASWWRHCPPSRSVPRPSVSRGSCCSRQGPQCPRASASDIDLSRTTTSRTATQVCSITTWSRPSDRATSPSSFSQVSQSFQSINQSISHSINRKMLERSEWWWWWWWLSICIAHYAKNASTALRVAVRCEEECLHSAVLIWTRIPSGIWSRLYGSFPSALNTYRASSQQCARGATKYTVMGQKFDPESLYEPIKFETLQPYLVNKH